VKNLLSRSALNVILLSVLVIHMVPIAVIFFNALRTNENVRRALLSFPEWVQFDNFVSAWTTGNFLVAFINTLVIGGGTVGVVLFVNVLAAYALTKLPVLGRDFFIGYFVVAIAVPSFAIVVPVYFGLSALGLVNSKLGIIIVYAAIFMPFSLLLMRSYFMGVPRDLEEAALIDGCSELGALLRVTLPLARPIIVTVVLIVFVHVYNEFLFANVLLQGDDARTVALSFYKFVGRFTEDTATISASAVIALAPMLALYFLTQRRFVEGMAAGGLKG
jgi:raffinose/stachyose/melibiose transport system permease protein